MKIEDHNKLTNRAKSKKDGVYLYKGYVYVVKDNNFIAFADYVGNVYVKYGIFNIPIGKCEKYNRRKKLNEYLNNLNP